MGRHSTSRSRRDLGVNPNPHRGCLYWLVIPGEPGEKRRPALVVSVDARNRLVKHVLAIPPVRRSEAAAYCASVNKELPTVHHWYGAANLGMATQLVSYSNFEGAGPQRVGGRLRMGPFGTYVMAGNVKNPPIRPLSGCPARGFLRARLIRQGRQCAGAVVLFRHPQRTRASVSDLQG